MNDQQIDLLLTETANDVQELLGKDAYRECFRRHRQAFHEKQRAYKESEGLLNQQENEYRKQAAKDKRLRDKKGGPPQKGYVWYDDSPCETGDPSLGFWGPPRKNSVLSPELLLMPVADGGKLPENKIEELEKYYILLLIIYDWKLPDCHLANENTLADLACVIDFYNTDNKQGIIKTAFNNVNADLTQKAAKTEQGNKEQAQTPANANPVIKTLSIAETIRTLIDQNHNMTLADCIEKTVKALAIREPPTKTTQDYVKKIFYAKKRALKQAEETK